MYSYVTREAERSAERYGLTGLVDELRSELALPGAKVTDRLKPLREGKGFFKKTSGPFRLVCKVRKLGSELVVCFLDICRRDECYEDFPDSYLKLMPSDADLYIWLAEESKK